MNFCILVTNLIVSTLSFIHKYPNELNVVATNINILVDPPSNLYIGVPPLT